MPLKALTLDLWLTLVWDSKELEEYRRLRRIVNFYRFVNRTHKSGGIKVDAPFRFNDARLAMEALSKKAEEYYSRGRDLHPTERGRMLFDGLGIKVAEDDASRIYKIAGTVLSNSGYMRRLPRLNPEAKPALEAFRKTFPDLRIALVSNAARSAETYRRILNSLGIGKYFDHFVISSEVGYLKPRKEIFQYALKLLDVRPHEALHIGDLFKADVVGAVSCGMNACLYSGLWHKYAQYENPGEHLPKDFKPRSSKTIVREIRHLKDALRVGKQIT